MAEYINSQIENMQNLSLAEGIDEEGTRENQNGASGDHDEFDVVGSSFYKDTNRKPEAKMPVRKYALYYNMQHRNRGHAVILNHENFKIETLKPRAGTDVDATNLQETLEKLGFDVKTHKDLSVAQIDSVLDEASQMDHSDNDCFVLACLSHGDLGILYANEAPYKNDSLWLKFTADKCPSLAGKPKLFIIQACQGKQSDAGVTMRTQVDGSPSYKIPSHADFVIAYSTIPGFYSFRNTVHGSWFVEALCEELNEHGFSLDLLTLLTHVNCRVAVDYETMKDHLKQMPSITYTLTRALRFSPKTTTDDDLL